MKPVRKLQPAVARKYKLGTHHTRIILPGKGEIDLMRLTLKEANELVATGNFPYLVLKPKPVKKAKTV